jgi:hypothetical protein
MTLEIVRLPPVCAGAAEESTLGCSDNTGMHKPAESSVSRFDKTRQRYTKPYAPKPSNGQEMGCSDFFNEACKIHTAIRLSLILVAHFSL